MRARRISRLLALLITGAVLVGCSAQAPSEVPAVDALVRLYDQRSGIWPTTGWWNSANAVTALTDYMIQSGDHRYSWVLENTYAKKRNAEQGNFINAYVDDTGWWALAWIRAYDLTGDPGYLATAQRDVDFMWRNHDDSAGLAPPVDAVSINEPRRTTAGSVKVQRSGSSAEFTQIPWSSASSKIS